MEHRSCAIEWNPTTKQLTLWLTIQPSAPHTMLVGLHHGRLKIKVSAPPVDGKANATIIAWLAKQFDVPKKHVELIQGDTTRYKKVIIHAPVAFPKDWPWEHKISTN